MCEKGSDFQGAKFGGMPAVMEHDIPTSPMDVGDSGRPRKVTQGAPGSNEVADIGQGNRREITDNLFDGCAGHDRPACARARGLGTGCESLSRVHTDSL
jgi:hypothetical protein